MGCDWFLLALATVSHRFITALAGVSLPSPFEFRVWRGFVNDSVILVKLCVSF